MINECKPAGSKPFVVMAKPVGRQCNLACGYCYYSGGKQNSSGQSKMTDELLELFIRQYTEASEGLNVHIVWHGGEPVLAGLDFYRKAAELQKRYLKKGQTCWNNLQTNGTLLDDKWCAFLAEEKFDVGLSVDGTAWLHDKYRKDKNGKGSYRKAAAAVRRLQAHGIQPDLLCTVTSSTAKEPLEVYRALRDFNTGWIQFIPVVRRDESGAITPDSVDAQEYGDFLCTIFDEWAHHDIGRLDVQLFAEAARVWAGGEAGLCTLSPTCGRALIVEADGGVYSCDHFVYPEYLIGNIKTNHLKELANLPFQRSFGEDKQNRLNSHCKTCPHLKVCGGGCPKDRFVIVAEGDPPLNYLCAGFKQFFTHARPATEKILHLVRRGLSPASIMTELRK